jgi:hypothetical protein
MKLTQKLKDFVKNPKRLNIALAFLNSILAIYLCSPSLAKEHSKVFPYEQGGLPAPFMTELVDDNRDGTPDRTLLHSIGPMFYNGQERKPTQSEIDYWNSH